MQFKNPANNYIVKETMWANYLVCLVIAPVFFMAKGLWAHCIISLILAFLTFGLSNFFFCFTIEAAIRDKYLQRGWVEL